MPFSGPSQRSKWPGVARNATTSWCRDDVGAISPASARLPWKPDAAYWLNNAMRFDVGLVVIAGGSVTVMVLAGELAVSPEVVLLATTVSVATGWPVPPYEAASVSPVRGLPVVDEVPLTV